MDETELKLLSVELELNEDSDDRLDSDDEEDSDEEEDWLDKDDSELGELPDELEDTDELLALDSLDELIDERLDSVLSSELCEEDDEAELILEEEAELELSELFELNEESDDEMDDLELCELDMDDGDDSELLDLLEETLDEDWDEELIDDTEEELTLELDRLDELMDDSLDSLDDDDRLERDEIELWLDELMELSEDDDTEEEDWLELLERPNPSQSSVPLPSSYRCLISLPVSNRFATSNSSTCCPSRFVRIAEVLAAPMVKMVVTPYVNSVLENDVSNTPST